MRKLLKKLLRLSLLLMLLVSSDWVLGQDVACVASAPIKNPGQMCSSWVVYSVNGTPGCTGPTSPEAACGQVCIGYNGSRIVAGGALGVCQCLDPVGNPTGGGPITSGKCGSCTQPTCDAGYEMVDGKCHARTQLEQDRQAAESGGRIVRDDHGNILSIEDPVGVTVEQQGGHDAWGRPGWIDDLVFQYRPGGDPLPIKIALGDKAAQMRWEDPAQLSQIYTDSTLYLLQYWPNGSLGLLSAIDRAQVRSTQLWDENGNSLTPAPAAPAVPADKPKTAPAVPGSPMPQLGVHQIAVQPAGSWFQIPVIAAGATLLYPPASAGLTRFLKDTWHHCVASVADNPVERAKFCADKYFEERLSCYRAVDAKYKGKARNDPGIINDAARDLMTCVSSAARRRSLCLLNIEESQWPPLDMPASVLP